MVLFLNLFRVPLRDIAMPRKLKPGRLETNNLTQIEKDCIRIRSAQGKLKTIGYIRQLLSPENCSLTTAVAIYNCLIEDNIIEIE
jgi:hypothetical protein